MLGKVGEAFAVSLDAAAAPPRRAARLRGCRQRGGACRRRAAAPSRHPAAGAARVLAAEGKPATETIDLREALVQACAGWQAAALSAAARACARPRGEAFAVARRGRRARPADRTAARPRHAPGRRGAGALERHGEAARPMLVLRVRERARCRRRRRSALAAARAARPRDAA